MSIFTQKYIDKIYSLEIRDKHLRYEFAELFNWKEKVSTNYFSPTPFSPKPGDIITRLPSWEEIFAHIDKILK